jgi:hypothetical protein
MYDPECGTEQQELPKTLLYVKAHFSAFIIGRDGLGLS